MSIKFFLDKVRVAALREKMAQFTDDLMRHRVYTHSLIDAKVEDGELTQQEAHERKQSWDERHK